MVDFVRDPSEPPTSGNLEDSQWQRWFRTLFDTVLGDGGSFEKLNIVGKQGTKGTGSNEYLEQQLIKWNCGHYVDYTTQLGTIAYGFACAVRRQAGNSLTVGAQIDAIAGRNGGTSVFGQAIESIGQYRYLGIIIGQEVSAACLDDTNTAAKWGSYLVYKDRGDGVASMAYGLGSNLYNYFALGLVIGAQARSSTGEFCGWTRGIAFIGDCLDTQTAPAWSAAVQYQAGKVVTSGGRVWQCIADNLNQVPAVPSAFWAFNTPAAGQPAAAIGIDFVSMSAAAAGRMASAIRLKDFMRFHWDVSGAIGTYYDSTAGQHILTENAGANIFQISVAGATAGRITSALPEVALGGGAAPTLGTIGGAGPGTAAQNGWWPINMNGNVRWVPTWK